MLKFLKGKLQRRFLLDIWGKYRLTLTLKNIDRTAYYFYRVKKTYRDMWAFRNKRYVYQLRVFYKFKLPRRLNPDYLKAKHLHYYYFNLSIWKLKKLLKDSFRRRTTPINHLLSRLDGRLLYILFKLGYEQNLFILEKKYAYQRPFILNNKEFWNVNKFLSVGDWLYLKPKLREEYWNFFMYKLKNGQVLQWFPKNFWYEPRNFLFVMSRKFREGDIFYIDKLDYMKINELGNFLR